MRKTDKKKSEKSEREEGMTYEEVEKPIFLSTYRLMTIDRVHTHRHIHTHARLFCQTVLFMVMVQEQCPV